MGRPCHPVIALAALCGRVMTAAAWIREREENSGEPVPAWLPAIAVTLQEAVDEARPVYHQDPSGMVAERHLWSVPADMPVSRELPSDTPEDGRYGALRDYMTGAFLRSASPYEWLRSAERAGCGHDDRAWTDAFGRVVCVDGGPDIAADVAEAIAAAGVI